MSTYKPFITSDVVVTPFKVNKSFTFKGASEFTASNVCIDRYFGKNLQSTIFVSGSNPTGQCSSQNQELVYESIKQLYYSNYLLNQDGSPIYTASFNEDGTITGEGGTKQPMYYNYLPDTLDANRLFPTASNDRIGVISIPSNLFGEFIKPGTFSYTYSGSLNGLITDDENGNLFKDGAKVGDIVYQHGIIILTSFGTSIVGSVYGTALYGTGVYSTAGATEKNKDIITAIANTIKAPCIVSFPVGQETLNASCFTSCINFIGFFIIYCSLIGRSGGTRTLSLRFWRPALYQLSYTPIYRVTL